MTVCLYDAAVVSKIKAWTEKTEINILGPSETSRLFEIMADKSDDSPIKLPILAITRPAGYTINNINKKPLTYDGITLEADNSQSLQLNAIPISIYYQLDIYTRYLEEADAYCRNLIFNFINYPNLKITIPYNNANIVHNSTIRIADEVEDNSNIPERFISGQFTRMSLNINIDDAYLWDARVRNNVSIDYDGLIIQARNPNDDEFITEQVLI